MCVFYSEPGAFEIRYRRLFVICCSGCSCLHDSTSGLDVNICLLFYRRSNKRTTIIHNIIIFYYVHVYYIDDDICTQIGRNDDFLSPSRQTVRI